MRPIDRAANLRRANAGSSRRRRRTLFAATAGPRAKPEFEVAPVAADPVLAAVDPTEVSDIDLEEFVIDDDDFAEVSGGQQRVEPAHSEPDRVDDIDEWLEEFAVSDYFDAMPR